MLECILTPAQAEIRIRAWKTSALAAPVTLGAVPELMEREGTQPAVQMLYLNISTGLLKIILKVPLLLLPCLSPGVG